jgi:hypothetical protein
MPGEVLLLIPCRPGIICLCVVFAYCRFVENHNQTVPFSLFPYCCSHWSRNIVFSFWRDCNGKGYYLFVNAIVALLYCNYLMHGWYHILLDYCNYLMMQSCLWKMVCTRVTEDDMLNVPEGSATCRRGCGQPLVNVSYAAPQGHRIVNVALPGIVFIFSQRRKNLYHV